MTEKNFLPEPDGENRGVDQTGAKSFRGFVFPPASTFCGENEEKSLENALGWLVIRREWSTTLGDSSRNSALPCSAMTHFHLSVHPSQEPLQFAIWHDRVMWRRGHLDFPTLSHRFLWLLLKNIVALELELVLQCRAKLSAMWTSDFILMEELPKQPIGTAAQEWTQRCSFVESFRQILLDWLDDRPQELSRLAIHRRVDGRDNWERSVMERVKRLAAKHYCQAFFDHLGRAPCVPHTLPSAYVLCLSLKCAD
ncbi:hypothetical protein AN958_08880 [Leucoagaricus sp. SymC.cos]|nr:hypothetical protein AN958_08880 [Leucoagaricus sp. SymC.cos]